MHFNLYKTVQSNVFTRASATSQPLTGAYQRLHMWVNNEYNVFFACMEASPLVSSPPVLVRLLHSLYGLLAPSCTSHTVRRKRSSGRRWLLFPAVKRLQPSYNRGDDTPLPAPCSPPQPWGNVLQLRFLNFCKCRHFLCSWNLFHKRRVIQTQSVSFWMMHDKKTVQNTSMDSQCFVTRIYHFATHLNTISQSHMSPDGCHASRQTSQAAVFSIFSCSVTA